MKDKSNLHQKVQEYIDCYATADPLKEMSVISNEKDLEAGALKWLAITVLHGINQNAEKIVLTLSDDGQVRVTADYRKTELPSPETIGPAVLESIKGILHQEHKKQESQFALGIRDSSVMLNIKSKTNGKKDQITIKFPKA